MKAIVSLAALVALIFVLAGDAARSQTADAHNNYPIIELGKRLFQDARFSSADGDLANSCRSCHLLDEDPQGVRAHTDFFNRSWVPWRREDPRRSELRNSPTILDCAEMPRLHFDGEFGSLPELIRGTLTGRPMGWLPSETDRALNHIYGVVLKDKQEADASYREEFSRAYGLDIDKASRDQVIDRLVGAIGAYLRSLRTSRTTPYDEFVATNGLPAGPLRAEPPNEFARRVLDNITALEKRNGLKLPAGFDQTALQGYKVFLTTTGTNSAGVCVTCHAPPLFTDFSFHNLGVSQAEYDLINGDGSFSRLRIPGPLEAKRPVAEFREMPDRQNPGRADLGYWNFVDLKSNALRRSTETDDQFLKRMIATFKTPTLRNLAYSNPYFHNGAFSTVEATIAELTRLSDLARGGLIREPDEELSRIHLSAADATALTQFLRSLNEKMK